MTNQVSLSSLKTAKALSYLSPIPLYDEITGQLTTTVDLQTLEYIFKDRTIDPYRCGIKVASPYNNWKLYAENDILLNVPGGQGEFTLVPNENNIIEINFKDGFNPFHECYIKDNLKYFIPGGVIEKLDVITCRNLSAIEILDYIDLIDLTGNFTKVENLDWHCTAKLDILDLRYINLNHLYVIGPDSYINKLYYKHNDKFLTFLNFKNSIIYDGGLTDEFINNLPKFNPLNSGTLYNISSIPATNEIIGIANKKNIIIKDVIL